MSQPTSTGGLEITHPQSKSMKNRPKRKLTPQQLENRTAYLFLTPWFLGLIFITIGPVLASLYLSFTRYNILRPPRWIGFENYYNILFMDRQFWTSVKVTFFYVGWSVPLVLIMSLAVATVLNRGLALLPIYRSIFYIPSLMGGSVGIGLLWREVFGAQGVFNDALAIFGMAGRSWIAIPETAPWILVTLNVWTFGASMVIFLAALRQIPASLYEAASIDGASAWTRFRRITIPMLTPIVFFNAVLLTIQSFQSFTQSYIVSGGTGGPADSTLLYSLYLYQRAFVQLDMGYGSAMAWILLLSIASFTGLIFWSAKYWVFYGE
ncbi:sugar ABC transporter permease [Devosia algicola]|uniref:Sugar ABC transporter permease n=1 Tax=Devosia algicola TaxID=3026418 RepID=A0ABY7YMC5_9HYPH|nr:sugar ABC transporter permease [Devosia algicola]WDR02362.1 sugar ABC transporter permease [Devosia algicola]